MAVSIQTSLIGQTFYSCDLDEITFSTNRPFVKVTLIVRNEETFASTYYAVNGTVRVRNLSSLFEAMMNQLSLVYATITLVANDGDNEQTNSFNILICRDHIIDLPAEDFLNGYFLTTNLNRLTTIHSKEQLSFYVSLTLFQNVLPFTYEMKVRLLDGTIQDFSITKAKRVGTGVVSIIISIADVQDWARDKYPGCTLLYFKVSYKNFVCRYYVQPCPSANVFSFTNNFGCRETVSFPAVTKSIIETDFSEAMVNGRLSHYDVRHSRTYEVETPPLLANHMVWLEQFVTSSSILVLKGEKYEPVLIKDYGYEHTNAPGEENTLSFTWEFADGRQTPHRISLHTGIFTEPFNEVYN